MLELKNIYKAEEIKFADYLRSKQPALLADWLRANPGWFDDVDTISYDHETSFDDPNLQRTLETQKNNALNAGWKVAPIRGVMYSNDYDQRRENYPTAFEIVDHFGDACTSSNYSILEPNTMIARHTGGENRKGLNIRIHVPLIIPEGDVGFEVWGEEVRWTDIFAFDNQKTHSAWNLTNERRLVFLIDLKREYCDIPKAPDWYPGCNDDSPLFPKTQREGHIWQSLLKNKNA